MFDVGILLIVLALLVDILKLVLNGLRKLTQEL